MGEALADLVGENLTLVPITVVVRLLCSLELSCPKEPEPILLNPHAFE